MDKRLEAIISLLAKIAVERHLGNGARSPPDPKPKKQNLKVETTPESTKLNEKP